MSKRAAAEEVVRGAIKVSITHPGFVVTIPEPNGGDEARTYLEVALIDAGGIKDQRGFYEGTWPIDWVSWAPDTNPVSPLDEYVMPKRWRVRVG
jgi:hypothetical protein